MCYYNCQLTSYRSKPAETKASRGHLWFVLFFCSLAAIPSNRILGKSTELPIIETKNEITQWIVDRHGLDPWKYSEEPYLLLQAENWNVPELPKNRNRRLARSRDRSASPSPPANVTQTITAPLITRRERQPYRGLQHDLHGRESKNDARHEQSHSRGDSHSTDRSTMDSQRPHSRAEGKNNERDRGRSRTRSPPGHRHSSGSHKSPSSTHSSRTRPDSDSKSRPPFVN